MVDCFPGVHPGRRGRADRVPADFQHRAQIIVADLIGFGGERAKAFNIIIQLAAILAVVWEFRGKIFQVVRDLPSQRQAQRFTANLLIAFFPAVVLGVLFADLIHEWLFNPITVALALVVGGWSCSGPSAGSM